MKPGASLRRACLRRGGPHGRANAISPEQRGLILSDTRLAANPDQGHFISGDPRRTDGQSALSL